MSDSRRSCPPVSTASLRGSSAGACCRLKQCTVEPNLVLFPGFTKAIKPVNKARLNSLLPVYKVTSQEAELVDTVGTCCPFVIRSDMNIVMSVNP